MSSDPATPPPPGAATLPASGPEHSDPGAPTLISQDRKPREAEPRPQGRFAALLSAAEGEEDTAISQKEVLAGRYEIRRELARGGMGRVLVAYDKRLGREIAVKEMLDSDQDARDRFEREVLVTARLQHPSIVTIHEAGLGPSGEPFYVMPQVPGRSLHDAIEATPKLADRLSLLPQVIAVCEALAYAHQNGVIHRDLKPANVLVGSFGETVVIDWGLAKVMGQPDEPSPARRGQGGPLDSGRALTLVGQVMGTPGYMAPEQARGAPLDPRCDVYALGAILWHLLTGAPPYDGPDANSVLAAVVAGPPPEPDWTGAPADLVDIVRRAMAHDPAQRYPSAQALVTDLRRFQSGQLVGAHRYSRLELAARWVNRYRTLLGVAGAALAALAVMGVVSLARVLESRRVAERERAAATAARDEAQRLQHQAELGRQRSLLQQARVQVGSDPTEALALLRQLDPALPAWDEARMLAEEARAAGVAGWELATPGPVALGVLHDGHRLALGTADGRVLLWDARDGSQRLLGTHGARIRDLTSSEDDARLVSGAEDGSARIWDLGTGAFRVLSGRGEPVNTSLFLGDGAVALFRAGFGIEFYDPATGQQLRQVAGTERVVLQPHAHAFLVRQDDEADLYTSVGEPRRLHLPAEWHFVSIGADARQVMASSLPGGLALFDVATGVAHRLGGLPGTAPDEHALLDSGTAVALLDNRNFAAWRPGAREPSRERVDCEARTVQSLLGDQALFVCEDGLELIDLARGTRQVLRSGSPETVIGVGGRLAALQAGDVLRIWDLEDLPRELEAGPAIDDLATAADGRHTITFGAGDAPAIDEVTLPGGPIRHLAQVPSALKARSVSRDGATVAWTRAGSDELSWLDVRSGASHRATEPGVVDLQLTPDGAGLLASTARGVALYDVASGAVTRVEAGGEPAFAAAGPGRAWLVTADRESRQLTVWSPAGQALRHLGQAGPRLALTADGRWLLSGQGSGDITAWDTRDWSERVLRGTSRGLVLMTPLPDSSAVLVLDADRSVRLRPLSGEPEREVARLAHPPVVLWPARDSRRVATIDVLGTVVVLDLASGASWRLRDPRGAFDDLDSAGGAWLTVRRDRLRLWRDDLPAQPERLLPVLQALPRPARLAAP